MVTATADIGGVKIKLKTTPTNTAIYSLTSLKKEDRTGLTAEKRHQLFQSITKAGQQDNFATFDVATTASNDLDDTHDLQVMVQEFVTRMMRSDVLNVFTIVVPKLGPDGKQTGEIEAETYNLIESHSRLTIAQVAASNSWYASWPDDTDSPWFKENLSLSCDYLFNHMEKDLYAKILEDYQPYENTIQAGGPLLFKLIMTRIQSTTMLVVESLQKKIKSLSLMDYPGEDVSQLVSHVKAVLRRLRGLEQKDANGNVIGHRHVPDTIAKDLITAFQTSSSPKFNMVFYQKEIEALQQSITLGNQAYGNPDQLLQQAEAFYLTLLQSSEGWHGAAHVANPSAFVGAADGPPTCFNCGKANCKVSTCPRPKDEARIAANKKKFIEAKKAKKTPKQTNKKGKDKDGKKVPAKWKRPQKGESNRRVIDGKEHYYHFKDQRWKVVDRNHQGGANAVHSGGGGQMLLSLHPFPLNRHHRHLMPRRCSIPIPRRPP